MAERESIRISFTSEQARFLNSLVNRGRYRSVSEAVQAAVRRFQQRQAMLDVEIDGARSDIEAGADQLDQGRSVDGGAFFAEWDAELEELEKLENTFGATPNASFPGRDEWEARTRRLRTRG